MAGRVVNIACAMEKTPYISAVGSITSVPHRESGKALERVKWLYANRSSGSARLHVK